MLTVGFVALLVSMDRYESELSGAEAISSRLDRLRTQQVQPSSPQPVLPALQAGIRQAGVVSGQLAIPWDSLWRAVEESRDNGNNDIALLSVELDPARGEIGLTGEARDFHALSLFTKALAEHGEFDRVTLTQHKLSDGSPPIVVRFDLRLAWRTPATETGS